MSDPASDPKAGRSHRKSDLIGFLFGMVIALLLLTVHRRFGLALLVKRAPTEADAEVASNDACGDDDTFCPGGMASRKGSQA